MFMGSLAARVVCAILLVLTFLSTQLRAADGLPDTSFSNDGRWTTDLTGQTAMFSAVAVQDDGKIVAVGYSEEAGGNDDFLVARFNADGSLDTTFSGDGWTTTDIFGFSDRAADVAIQDNGKIVVVGGADNGSDNDFCVVRYNAGGGLDTTFDGDGIQTRDWDSDDDRPYAVAIQDDGAILVAGAVSDSGAGESDAAITRFTPTGDHDPSFGTLAMALADYSGNDVFFDLALLSDGRIAACGCTNVSQNTGDFLVAVFDTDGNADASFGTNGVKVNDSGGLDVWYTLAVTPDDEIVAGGMGNDTNVDELMLATAKYLGNGDLDSTFGNGGMLFYQYAAPYGRIMSMDIAEDGKITAAGVLWDANFNRDYTVFRFLENGGTDTEFGQGGIVSVGSYTSSGPGLATQDDGNLIIVGGYETGGGDRQPFAARYKNTPQVSTSGGGGSSSSSGGGCTMNSGPGALPWLVVLLASCALLLRRGRQKRD